MASLQAQFLKLFLKVDRIFSGSADDLDVNKERLALEKTARMFIFPKDVREEIISVNGFSALWVIPYNYQTNRTILYFHGGSYNAGSIKTHRHLVANIAVASKARALIVEYRLAPENPFPAAIQDAKTSYEWLIDNGCPPKNIILAGDSAGGGLILALLHSIKSSNMKMPAAAVCLSPWADLTGSGDSILTNARKDILLNINNLNKSADIYVGKADIKDRLISPLFGTMESFPPLLIQVGSDELLLSDSVSFSEKARKSGVDVTLEIWQDMQHVWQFAGAMVPESLRAIQAIGKFIDSKVD